MFRTKILLGVFAAAFALLSLFAKPTIAQTPSFEFLSQTLDSTTDIAVSGNLAYVTNRSNLYIFDISNPEAPVVLGNYHAEGCFFWAIDVADNIGYAAQAAAYFCDPYNSLYILDVSDPANPTQIGDPINVPGPGAAWELAVSGNYVYLVDAHGGLKIIDIVSREEAGSFIVPGSDFRDVKIVGNLAFLADVNQKMWVVDISNKSLPIGLDSIDLPGNSMGIAVKDNLAYVANGSSGVRAVDISNPQDIFEVGNAPIDDFAGDVEISGDYLFVANDTGGVVAMSLSDPTHPVQVDAYNTSGNVFRVTVSGDLIFAADLNKGMVILRFSGINGEAPAAFLDLPWEIGQLTFERAALNPNSWFDHRYPLQNYECCAGPVTNFTGRIINEPYRSHDGYDYGQFSGVFLNTPVQAAAPGWATFVSESHSGGFGNLIKIDHENGYQTWYAHLQPGTSLIVQTEGQRVYVNRGQTIGLTGMSGKATGPHIHFSVFKDSDGFEDEYPFGVTDPLGWDGSYADPWPADMGGAQSSNLFIARAKPQVTQIPTGGGSLIYGDATITVPNEASSEPFTLTITNGPFEGIFNTIRGIVPSFFLNAVNGFGQQVNQFLLPIQFSYDYSSADLSNIDEGTLQFYSFNDQSGNWDPTQTTLDMDNNVAYGETLHFSQFALMGRVKDFTAPITRATISGTEGLDGWYRSDVRVELAGRDNQGGIGLQYILYTLDGSEWMEYQSPLNFSEEGSYIIIYQAFDKAENTEGEKTIEFNIDKTPPTVAISTTLSILWPADGQMVPVIIDGEASDLNLFSILFEVIDEYQLVEPTLGGFGQTILLEAQRNESDTNGRKYLISVTAKDRADNRSHGRAEVIVPQDLR